jgi:hypothetical protein
MFRTVVFVAVALAAAQAQAPPDTEIYLAALSGSGDALAVDAPVNVTNSPGYDNQPFFMPDSSGILFTSNRGGRQTDVYRYDIGSKHTSGVTDTPESEYSPTVTPDGGISVIRVEADGTQRLWRFTESGTDPTVLLPDVKPVGYHAWSDAHTVVLFALGQPATLQIADTASGKTRVVARDVGRSLVRIPGTTHVSFVQREQHGDRVTLSIRELDPASGAIAPLVQAVEGSAEADCAWTPDGLLLMALGGKLYGWRRGSAGWTVIYDLAPLGLKSVSRLAVSGNGKWLAIVAAPPGGA